MKNDEGWMKNDELWRVNYEGSWFQAVEGFWMDICECRVALATDNYFHLNNISIVTPNVNLMLLRLIWIFLSNKSKYI